ncbi:uncharacterized protein LOC118463836 isoform X2 [Anopheles albimanus]|uniref:uncharacterized protein LOC118463836 isoform X2 n=1 Tax=Anopheles albimanus TaxID=7167 RepID=UPI0016403537|nr:uncharacterized protein LOC118463836 isoform X2 [Anopheles albimanus]
MFGSKLRSWMENHIVRPRKKGSKSKTGSSGSNFGVLTAQNGYSKSGTFTGDSTVGSPARRSEVSPIQNHTTSRRGWHSPNQDSVPISPKSDHYPLQHRLPSNNGQANGGGALNGVDHSSVSHYQPSNHQHQQQQQQQYSVLSSPRSISRNGSSYTLEPGPPVNVYYSKSVDSFAASDGSTVPYAMPEFDFRSDSGHGPSSVGGGGGGSSAVSASRQLVAASHSNITYATGATSSSSELLEELHDGGGRIKRMQHPATAAAAAAATASRISSSSSSSVNSNNHHHHHHHHNVNNHFNNNHMVNGSLSQYPLRGSHTPASAMATVESNGEPKYGKLLPQQPMATQYGDHRPIYYDHPQHQQQQQQHNGINNNLVYSTSPHPARANGSGHTPPPPPVRHTPPLQRAAHPTHPTAANGNRIINGSNNNNNNNNNNNHLEVVGGGTGRAPNNHSGGNGTSFTTSFANKFHKLTGTGSRATHDTVNGAGASASGVGVGGSKLNHVNNNNGLATGNGSHKLGNSSSSSSSNTTAVLGPPYQINNVSSTHLHPAAQTHHHHHHQLHQAPSSSSSSSSPPPSAAAAAPASQGGGQTQHLHHPAHGQPHHHHHHPHGHTLVGHTLSSPESAYSTGYSTDGTSPGGCSYTPEYYINIRTGTHYFAKGTTLPGRGPGVAAAAGAATASGAGAGCTDGGTKFKCALNRIEEKHVEFCVEQEKDSPRRTSTAGPVSVNLSANLKPTGPGLGQCALSQTQQQQPQPQQLQQQQQQQPSTGTTQPQASLATSTSQAAAAAPCSTAPTPNAVAMSPIMQKNLGMQHYRSIESPSPRQRCRIRTNPWLTTADGALASNGIKRTEQDSGSTSSGIKSSSGTDDNKHDNKKPNANSDTDSSSSTEKIVNKRILTPRSLKKIGDIGTRLDSKTVSVTFGSNQESDEDATLNEMMGKFDESYHYEKETDILSCSDSDPTDCPTDIDTGQDAGDECDTDDLLDLDFIDTGSVLEDKETFRHTTSCSIHSFTPDGSKQSSGVAKQRSLRNKRSNESGAGSKRRKKLVRTRKKQSESVTTDMGANGDGSSCGLVSRGCRSLGGTPMSLRRNQRQEAECRTPVARSSPLTNRCNSLTFTEVNTLHSRILAISESEKALLRADLEADVKYKQLIHEAESILFSMKSNSSICLKEQTASTVAGQPPPLPPREPLASVVPPAVPAKEVTPQATIASPRRVCNPPANKRVEMLRNCEADLRRELAKTCSQKCAEGLGMGHPVSELNPAEGVIVNKRLEVLRYDTSPCSLSAPNSPKNTRVLLPRKTHLSNFMQHQQSSNARQPEHGNDLKHCANGASAVAPPPPPPRLLSKSPTIMRRRFRSQSPHLNIESDSDSDDVTRNLDSKTNGHKGRSNKENHMNPQQPTVALPGKGSVTGKQMNNFRHTIHGGGAGGAGDGAATMAAGELHLELNGGMHKSPLISFRSVDIGSPVTDDSYCPQSEPLKRKIYTCSAAFERIQRTLDQDPELSKKALLERITLLRRDRQAMKSPRHEPAVDREKNEMIMDTLAEIKRIFEDQSIELNQLNDSDN